MNSKIEQLEKELIALGFDCKMLEISNEYLMRRIDILQEINENNKKIIEIYKRQKQ